MKKSIFGIISFLCIAGFMLLYSVKTEAQVTYGIKAGVNFAGLSYKDNNTSETSKLIKGLEGGAFVNIPVSGLLFIQPSLMYERKGGRLTTDIGGLPVNGNMRLDYLTLPVDLAVNLKSPGGNASWLVGAGPYIGYGIYGNAMVTGDNSLYSDNPFENNTSVGGASLKRFDAGANIQIDYEMANHFSVGVNAELGIANIAANKAGDNPVHNTSFGAMIGYTFK